MPPPDRQPVDVQAFAGTQLALLDAELQCELQETSGLIAGSSPAALQRGGLAITNLVVSAQRTGLGGRTVVELGPDPATSGSGPDGSGELPEHGVRTGDIVLVSEQPAGSAKKREVRDLERNGSRGVVTRLRKTDLSVALDAADDAADYGADMRLGGSGGRRGMARGPRRRQCTRCRSLA